MSRNQCLHHHTRSWTSTNRILSGLPSLGVATSISMVTTPSHQRCNPKPKHQSEESRLPVYQVIKDSKQPLKLIVEDVLTPRPDEWNSKKANYCPAKFKSFIIKGQFFILRLICVKLFKELYDTRTSSNHLDSLVISLLGLDF